MRDHASMSEFSRIRCTMLEYEPGGREWADTDDVVNDLAELVGQLPTPAQLVLARSTGPGWHPVTDADLPALQEVNWWCGAFWFRLRYSSTTPAGSAWHRLPARSCARSSGSVDPAKTRTDTTARSGW